MALNSSGPLSFGGATTGQSINLELGVSATALASINSTAFRTLAGVPSGAISVSNFYGKSNATYFMSFLGSFKGVTSTVNSTGYMFFGGRNNSSGRPQVLQLDPTGATAVSKSWTSSGTGGYENVSMAYAGTDAYYGNTTIFATPGLTTGATSLKTQGNPSTGTPSYYNLTAAVYGPVVSPNPFLYTTQLWDYSFCCSSKAGWTINAGNLNNGFLWGYANGPTFLNNVYSRGISVGTDPNNNALSGGSYIDNGGTPSAAWIKYNSSGTLINSVGINQGSECVAIAGDSSSNVYAAFRGSTNQWVTIVGKWDSSATLQWSRVLNSSGASGATKFDPYNIAFDSSGNVYVLGATEGATSSWRGVALAKWNSSGTLQWVRKIYQSGSGDLDLTKTSSNLSIAPNGAIAFILQFGGSNALAFSYSPAGTTGSYVFSSLGSTIVIAAMTITEAAQSISTFSLFSVLTFSSFNRTSGSSGSPGTQTTLTVTPTVVVI